MSNKNKTNNNSINNNIFFASLQGLRSSNEDCHSIFYNIDNHDPNFKAINLFAVYDGHGGKQVSDYLSKVLPKYFIDPRVKYPLSKTYIMNVYDDIQKQLEKQSYSKHTGSTALVVIQYKQNNDMYLNIINLGDCRCIISRDNLALPLTKDHKPYWPEEKRRITSMGGKIEFDGYDWRIKDLSVSRAFGDLDAKPYVSHLPDLYRYRLDKSDKFIIIGCDGLYDYCDNSSLVNYILNNCYDNTLTKRINKDMDIANKLAHYAIESGSSDNISCIILFLD